MKRSVPALILIWLAIVIWSSGCDKNDENTVNSLPKSHDVFPVFYLRIDNGFDKFGIDSMVVTVDPDVGWLETVQSDANGFIGTMASGTYITDIDTIVEIDPDTQEPDTTFDTTTVVIGFLPSNTYTFEFVRANQFDWADSFKAVYAMTVDSVWAVVDAETLDVSKEVDSSIAYDTVLNTLILIDDPADTAGNPPDSIQDLEKQIGYWFDTAFVVTDPLILTSFPPDSIKNITESWGYWYRIDSFYMSIDSANWCDIAIDTIVIDDETTYVEQIEIRIDTFNVDLNQYPTFTIDTIYHYAACPEYPGTQTAIYRTWGWANHDTTIHAVYPDTSKSLLFKPDGTINVVNHVANDTNDAVIYLKDASGERVVNNLQIPITMPPVEVYPQYEIIVRDEGK